MFAAVLSYHPDIGTFRGKRGAWRVVDSYKVIDDGAPRIKALPAPGNGYAQPVLLMDVRKQLHRNTFVNPTKLLRESLATRQPPRYRVLPDGEMTSLLA